jgi:hypothetical protein
MVRVLSWHGQIVKKLHPHIAEGELSGASFTKALDPFRRAPLS